MVDKKYIAETDEINLLRDLISRKIQLWDIHPDHRTKLLCETAVSLEPYSFRYVPEHLKSEYLCLLAVSKDAWNIDVVPIALRTIELCRIAYSLNEHTISFIPHNLKEKVK